MEKIKVLYIDDELINLNAFKASFRRMFDIHLASSADEGLKILNEHPIEVILSDQRMPGKTGVDFFETILETHPTPMRILLTAFSDINAVIDAINKGQVYRYVTKPWSEFELKLTIENAYRIYSLKEQNDKISAKYSRVFNESSDPILLFDEVGRVVDYNKAAIEALETNRKDIHFSSFLTFLPDTNSVKSVFAELDETNSIVDKELEIVTKKGNVKTCLLAANTIRNAQQEIVNYQVIFKDITQRKASNKLLLKTIIETQENERERISKDLHDGLGQTLAALKLNLDAVKSQKQFREKECSQIEELLKESTRQLRDICFDTLPSVLTEYGIVKAIEELVSRSESDYLTIDFKYSKSLPKLYKSLEVAIYRIVQEFINNTIKHSEAKRITITIMDKGDDMALNLIDNGKGFVVKDLMIIKGQGLKNIESRVKSFNGNVEFNSEINKGTEFKISFPVHLN